MFLKCCRAPNANAGASLCYNREPFVGRGERPDGKEKGGTMEERGEAAAVEIASGAVAATRASVASNVTGASAEGAAAEPPATGAAARAASSSGGSMTARQWLALAGLTCSAFVFNTSEFMPIGLLSSIAGGFGLTEAQAGMMTSIYAWAVMALSLPLMVFASRFEFKRLLLAVIVLFTAGQFACAVAPTFAMLVTARLLVACAHAIFWSIASVMATRAVAPEHGSLALSMVATGTSVAMVFGLPLGRAIGLAVGWRMTFACVGVVGAALAVYMAAIFPPIPAGERFGLRQLPGLFRNRALVAVYVSTLLVATGYYTAYSYIDPYLTQVAHLEAGTATMALTVFGAAGFAGSLLFSRAYDAHRLPFLGAALVGLSAALLLLNVAAPFTAGIFSMLALWGACNTAFGIAFQAEIIRYARPDEASVAVALYSGIFNLGIGSGSFFGGMASTAFSLSSIGPVGGVLAAAGSAVCLAGLARAGRPAK